MRPCGVLDVPCGQQPRGSGSICYLQVVSVRAVTWYSRVEPKHLHTVWVTDRHRPRATGVTETGRLTEQSPLGFPGVGRTLQIGGVFDGGRSRSDLGDVVTTLGKLPSRYRMGAQMHFHLSVLSPVGD